MLGMTEIVILGAMAVATLLFLMIGAGVIGSKRKRKNQTSADNQQYWLSDDGELSAFNDDENQLDERPKHHYDRSS